MKVRSPFVGLSLAALLSAACDDRTPPAPVPPRAKVEAQKPPGPSTVLRLDVSAYRARLDFDGDTLAIATPRGLHLVEPGSPAAAFAHDFGDVFGLSGSRVVYFREGQLWETKGGASATPLGSVAREPSALVLNRERLAWLESDVHGPSRIQTFQDGQVRRIVEVKGRIDTLELFESWVFFFEQGPSGTWRLGGAPVDGGAPKFTAFRSGRVPSTLEAAGELFFYDGPTRSVRRISPDLEREEVLRTGIICSPLAVRERAVCAQVGGLFELPLRGGEPERLAAQTTFVAALATAGDRVAWVSDSGKERLDVKALDLPPRR